MLLFEKIEPQPPALSKGFEWQIIEHEGDFDFVAYRQYDPTIDEPGGEISELWDTITAPFKSGVSAVRAGDVSESEAREAGFGTEECECGVPGWWKYASRLEALVDHFGSDTWLWRIEAQYDDSGPKGVRADCSGDH